MNNFTLPSLPQKRYLTIAEASKFCNVPATTLRYWESKFPMLKPSVRTGRRYYRQQDIAQIFKIKYLVQDQNLSINDALLAFSKTPSLSTPPAANLLTLKSAKAKKLYADAKKKEVCTGFHYLNPDFGFSLQNITKICRVSEKTAGRYLKAQKAPYAVCRLLELESRGRILPDKWTHCFINKRGNLEIYQVGEVSEDDIVSIQWTNQLFNGRINTLTRDLSASEARVKELEALLAQEQAKHIVKADNSPVTNHETTRCNMKNPNLYSVKSQLEIVIEAFQGLEHTASRSDGDAMSVGSAMVPIIFLAEDVLKDMETICERSKATATGETTNTQGAAPLVLLTFPKAESESQ